MKQLTISLLIMVILSSCQPGVYTRSNGKWIFISYDELIEEYNDPFKIKVHYHNGDSEVLNVLPIRTFGSPEPIDLYIDNTSSSSGYVVMSNGSIGHYSGKSVSSESELKSTWWDLRVNGSIISSGDVIAVGVRRFEIIR